MKPVMATPRVTKSAERIIESSLYDKFVANFYLIIYVKSMMIIPPVQCLCLFDLSQKEFDKFPSW